MQTIIVVFQAFVSTLQGIFMVVGSLVSYSVLFYSGIEFISARQSAAIDKLSSIDPIQKDIAEKRIRHRADIIDNIFYVLIVLAGIGIIALNFDSVGIAGGVATIFGCLFVHIIFLAN